VQLLAAHGFWFSDKEGQVAGPARTLKEVLTLLPLVPAGVVAAHAAHGDFSRWVGGVFHDHALASDIRKAEQRFRLGHIRNFGESITKLIQERYELSPPRAGEAPAVSNSEEAKPASPDDVKVRMQSNS